MERVFAAAEKSAPSLDLALCTLFAALDSARGATAVLTAVKDEGAGLHCTPSDAARLRDSLKQFPAIDELLTLSADETPAHCSAEVLRALNAVLFVEGEMRLVRASTEDVSSHRFASACEVFEVRHTASKNFCFDTLARQYGTKTGFHGSPPDSWWSIIQHGIKSFDDPFNERHGKLFGAGVYLTTDLEVALNFAPVGTGWLKSKRGDVFSCVALCEYIDHPTVRDGGKFSESESSSTALVDRVPGNYVVVPCDEFVRVRKLLVFRRFSKSSSARRTRSSTGSGTWALILLVLLYCGIMYLSRFSTA